MSIVVVLITGSQPSINRPLERLHRLHSEVRWDARTLLRADIDCDGRQDDAVLGRHAGRVYVAVVYATRSTPDVLDFAVDPAIQDAICAEPATLDVESLDVDAADAAEIEGFRRSTICKGLRLSGGQCDSVHLYWNHRSKRLDWWRL